MANDVKIILTAVDKASGVLKGTTTNVKGMLTAIGAVSGVAIAAGTAIKKIADETVAYNKSIRELTQVTGTGAEEISRIVQVADDWGISIDQVRTALSMMNKNGMAPTIDNLAALADEYVNTTDKTEFAEKAAKLLGRQYTTLIPLLAKGGQAFRDQAAAIDESLLATEASIKAARDYEVAVDNLNDRVLALKYSIGNVLVPALSVALTPATEEVINGQKYLVQRIGDTVYATKRLGGRMVDATREYNAASAATIEYTWAKKDELVIVEGVTKATEELNYAIMNSDYFASRASSAFIEFGEGLDKVTGARLNTGEIVEFAKGIGFLAVESGKAAGPVSGFLDSIDREVQSPITNLIKDMEWVAAGGGAINTAFDTLKQAADQKLLPPDQIRKIAERLLTITTDFQLELDTIDPKTARENLEEGLGAAMAKVVMQDIKGTEGLAGALADITGIQYYLDFVVRVDSSALKTLPSSGGVTVNPKWNDRDPDNGRARGGPVMSGVPYTVGERGPEMFVPNQSGTIIPNNQMGGMSVDITINATPGMDVNAVANAVIQKLSIASRTRGAGGYARGA